MRGVQNSEATANNFDEVIIYWQNIYKTSQRTAIF